MPNGRKAEQPLSENIGVDDGNLLSALQSAARMNQSKGLGGISFNVWLSPSQFRTRVQRSKLAALVRQAMRLGIFQLQFNVIDSATLHQAQGTPEDYRDLSVRIAGYSDYFTGLCRAQQQELIARVEHSLRCSSIQVVTEYS